MLSKRHTGSLLMRRSLASVVVVSVSLMSAAVDACQTVRFFNAVRCADESPSMNYTSETMASPIRTFCSAYCEKAEFCTDATTSVMRPAARVEVPKAHRMIIGAAFAVYWSGREYPSYTAESPPHESLGVSPPSINLRI
jgi:hypothetical protein